MPGMRGIDSSVNEKERKEREVVMPIVGRDRERRIETPI